MSDKRRGVKWKSDILASILVFYIYVPYFVNILENSFHVSSLYGYIIYAIMALTIIGITMSINKKVLLFLMIFSVAMCVNSVLVSYTYYVIIEGIQALIGIAIPCLCISNNIFNLRTFIEKWWNFSSKNIILVLFAVVLLRKGMVHYSIFTSICVPNVFIGSYMILQGIKKRKWLYCNVMINIAITAVLGGRMSAVISACMILFAYLYSEKVWKKTVIIVGMAAGGYIVWSHLLDILYWISQKLDQYGIHSRSVMLLINQIESHEVYLTNRDYIYTECISYIKTRWGLPGGFGVPLYLTSGEYYYAHNVILQFLILFGLWGSILLLGVILIRARKLKYSAVKKCRIFIYFMMVCYLGIGMMGSSIWIHYLSTILIALFFFGNERVYNSIEENTR